jgi:hypothetical protein
VPVDYLGKGATITAKYYATLLDKMRQQLVCKYQGKLLRAILFLQESAAPHKAAITHKKFADLCFEVLKHPTYSLDLAPLDYTTSFLPSREESIQALRRPH